jgi:hypothetical protein
MKLKDIYNSINESGNTNYTQEQIDDMIYIASEIAEKYLKHEFKNLDVEDVNDDIEKFIDYKSRTALESSFNKSKFDNFIRNYKNKSIIRKEFIQNEISFNPYLKGKIK